MNQLLNLSFESSPVRIVVRDGDPWFVAADVAAILGYSHGPHMVRIMDDDEAAVHIMHTGGQNREVSIISESGLYNAIFKSRRAEAKAFRRWVTGTVLPQIRRTGSFTVHSDSLHGPMQQLPQLLDGKTAVTLPDTLAQLRIKPDNHALAYLAEIMRGLGWRKAWVRADAVDQPKRLFAAQDGEA